MIYNVVFRVLPSAILLNFITPAIMGPVINIMNIQNCNFSVIVCGYVHGSLTLRNIYRLWVVENNAGKNSCTREEGSTGASRENCTVRNYMICTW